MNTPRLILPNLATNQAQKEITHNEALNKLDAFVQTAVESMTLTAPPAGVEGNLYVVAAGATGAWAGKDNYLAQFIGGAWAFYAPFDGLRAWDKSIEKWILHNGGAWAAENNGGASITVDLYANRPAAGNEGNLFFPTDDIVIQRDNGVTWDGWLVGPMVKPVALSDFSLVNQGTATILQQGAGIVASDTSQLGFACRILEQAAPPTPYTLTIGFETMSKKTNSGGMMAGIILRDSATGKFSFWQTRIDNSGNICAQRGDYNSPTSFNTDGTWHPTIKPHNFLRVTNDGTNLSFGYSSNGIDFITLETIVKTAFVANIDKIGMCIECYNQPGKTRFFHWEVL